MEAPFYDEPSCSLCRIRDLLSCGVFSFNRNFTCTHLSGFHEKCGCARVWWNQLDDSMMPLVVAKGSQEGYIAKVLSEGKEISDPVEVPPMHGFYDWDARRFELPEPGRGCVSFTADTSNDVHVAVSARPESMDPMYEVVVGGWSNTTSVVRRRSQGPLLCTAPVGLKKPLPDSVEDLWLSVDKKTQLIQVGRGTEPSLESLLCIYKDPQFLRDAQYICFTSWDAPATYSNIKLSALE